LGLAPNKFVGLRHLFPIQCKEIIKDNSSGKILELHCIIDYEKKEKPKSHIHWLSTDNHDGGGKEPLKAEIRLYKPPFLIDNPSDDWEKNF